jgi:putative PIG3 family NAD(P)H quinone oxidoreductase
MRAIVAEKDQALRVEMIPLPVVTAGRVLIKIAYAGINRPDLIQRMGLYPPPKGAPDTMGLECSGTVVARADDVATWEIGDRVMALLPGGGYADYAWADAGSCMAIPDGLSLLEAAAMPETVLTVWANVFERGGLQPQERFLVHGGASGIGTMAIQMAKAHGAYVFATAGGAHKAQFCAKLGADCAIDYQTSDFCEVVRAQGGADVILDMVGGDYTQKNLDLLNPDGRCVQIAFLRGPQVALNLMPLMLKRLTLTGSTLRARPNAEKARLAKAVQAHVWPWVADGRVRPVIDQIFPLDQAEAAQAHMNANAHIGKIMLSVHGDG